MGPIRVERMGRRYCCAGPRRSLESSTFLNFDVVVNNFRDSQIFAEFFSTVEGFDGLGIYKDD